MEEVNNAQAQEVKKSMMPMIVMAVIVLVAFGSVGFFLMRGNNTRATPAVEGVTQESAPATIEVEGGSFYYKPNEIRVKVGQPVKIVLTTKGGMHDFVLDEFNAKTTRVGDGQTTSVEFTPDKAGIFEFYCSVGNHRAMGMKGNLIVE